MSSCNASRSSIQYSLRHRVCEPHLYYLLFAAFVLVCLAILFMGIGAYNWSSWSAALLFSAEGGGFCNLVSNSSTQEIINMIPPSFLPFIVLLLLLLIIAYIVCKADQQHSSFCWRMLLVLLLLLHESSQNNWYHLLTLSTSVPRGPTCMAHAASQLSFFPVLFIHSFTHSFIHSVLEVRKEFVHVIPNLLDQITIGEEITC